MSEEEAAAVGDGSVGSSSTDGAGSGIPTAPPGKEITGELGRFWIKVAGWMVMALGALTILLALHLRAEYDGLPFLMMVGMIFSGISYVLAGQGLGQGYQWPLPLAAVACVLSPAPWLTIPAALGFNAAMKEQLVPSALRKEITSSANLAYGLWVVGFVLAVYSGLVSGHCAPAMWPVSIFGMR